MNRLGLNAADPSIPTPAERPTAQPLSLTKQGALLLRFDGDGALGLLSLPSRNGTERNGREGTRRLELLETRKAAGRCGMVKV
jgi:hypothetical protein